MTRRTVAYSVVAVLLLAVVVKAATGFGPALPGPHVGDIFGRGDGVRATGECRPSDARVLSPAYPKPLPGRWRAEPRSPVSRSEVKGAALDGLIYIVGGQGPGGRSLATVLTFDPRRRVYARAPDMPERVDHPLVVAHAGALYVAGGYIDSEPTNRVWRYTRDGGWTPLASLRTARGGLTGGVVADRLYAVSGAPRTFPELGAKPYSSLEIYDFRSGRWTPGPPIPTARHHTAAAVVAGKLYVAGGRVPDDFSDNAFERLDPRSGHWEKLPPLPLGAGGLAAVAARGKVVVIGGDDERNWTAGRGWVTGSTWSFDPARSRWRRLPDLGVPRHAHAAAVAAGRIYVFGGATCPGFGRTDAAESLPLPE